MPQKLTVNDYQFYLIRNTTGKYAFKGTRGNLCRKTYAEYERMQKLMTNAQKEWIIELLAISQVQVMRTGEWTLVYDTFEDLREEE